MLPIPVIAGPTAVGKSRTAIELGRLVGPVELVSCDSRQVYRGMDIGTAKPDAATLRAVRHHFIDELDVGQSFSAGEFQLQAEDRIADIISRGSLPIVVGGSTLYLRALIDGIGQTPRVPPDVRSRLNERLKACGGQALFDELMSLDPEYAATLDRTKTQRVVRGLEVYEATGRPLSSFQKDHRLPRFQFDVFVLSRSRPTLYAEINRRVDNMVQNGLVQEVGRFHEEGFSEQDAAFRTIGYQELFPVLRDEYTQERGVELVKRNSRRYAKRQLTWYRRMERAVWLDVDNLSPAETAANIISMRPVKQ